jgi:methyl-accepting chemotaxis protein
MIQSIAAAAEEQSTASTQVANNIERISSFTRQSSEGASQAAQASGQLSDKAEQLQRLVKQFKIDSKMVKA